MKIKHTNKLKKDQNGIVSMVVVMLIMTLLSLITLSMTKNSNREQRQALDNQLSVDALTAAESGANDAFDYIKSPPPGPTPPDEKTDCSPLSGAGQGNQFPGKNAVIDAEKQESYSCVLYDRTPKDLELNPVSTAKSKVLKIKDKAGANINSLTFSWTDPSVKDGTQSYTSCPSSIFTLPKSLDSNCAAGVLRVELIDPTATTRQELLNRDFVAYLKPFNGVGRPEFYFNGITKSRQGKIFGSACSAGGQCSLTINGISNVFLGGLGGPKSELLLHIRSIYKNNSVTITGTTTGPVTRAIEFKDAQVLIDSTGKATDVVKRIQVRKGLSQVFPEFALQTTDPICKKIRITNDISDSECL